MRSSSISLEEGKCCHCAYFMQWTENQSPYGSGEYWPMTFTDCGYNWQEEPPEGCGITTPCPHWKPVEVYTCPRHGQYLDGCDKCEYEYLLESKGWERWFAWYPVQLGRNGGWVWLRWVWRSPCDMGQSETPEYQIV